MRLALPTILAASMLLAAPPAWSQCFGDDGFNVPGACCVPVTPNLPNFPALTLAADGACFLNCSVEAVFPATIAMGGPAPLFCDLYIIPISISGVVTTVPDILVSKYLRTWEEVDPTGVNNRQVWRFQVNADLTYAPPFAPPCPTPVCASSAGLKVHFVGHLDFARDCFGGNWSAATTLAHLCGDLAHGNLSGRPTTASHPSRLFAFAAPTPFAFAAAVPVPTGPVIADAFRSARTNLASLQWDCLSEVPVFNGQHALVAQACDCATSANPPLRWQHTNLTFSYGCNAAQGANFTLIPWAGVVPTGLSWFPLGRYAVPASVYPAGEAVAVGFGLASAADACGANFPANFLYGVATSGGELAILPNSGIVTTDFIDLVNSMMLIPPPPFVAIGYGALYVSTMVWSLNF